MILAAIPKLYLQQNCAHKCLEAGGFSGRDQTVRQQWDTVRHPRPSERRDFVYWRQGCTVSQPWSSD